jgi:TonB family protein
MKNIRKLAVVSCAGILLAASSLHASIEEKEQAYVESYQGRTDVPVPVEVVSPQVASLPGDKVVVRFVVNEMGKPTNLTVVSTTDEDLVAPVLSAVALWKFQPMKVEGTPVAKTVVLPVRFVNSSVFLASSY